MAKLIAKRNILYQNRMYDGGDELPFYDERMVNAWVDAGSAVWKDDEAESVTAPPVAEPIGRKRKTTKKG